MLKLFAEIPPGTLWTIGLVSALTFVVTLVAIPFILIRLPETYFDERVPRSWMKDSHPVLRILGMAAKNVVGLVFLLAGIAMLVLPGQGVLTMLIGITLLDFPGKQRLEAQIVGRPAVLGAINALRAKFGKRPLTIAPLTHSQS